MTFDPWTDDDVTAGPEKRGGVYNRPKPTIAWDPEPANPMDALRKGARIEDARNSVSQMVPPVRQAQPKRSLFGRVQPAQFGGLPGLDEEHESMRDNPPSKVPPSDQIMDRPREYVTQQNWQRGMGDTFTERNFSPRARAQGHLLGAGAMFLAVAPPLVDRARVTQIKY